MVPLFAGMLTQRPWEDVTNGSDLSHLTVPTTKENKEMVQQYAQQYIREIAELLVRVPRELLLLLKTNDCLRSVDNILVGQYHPHARHVRWESVGMYLL